LPLRSISGSKSLIESKRNGRHGAGPFAQGRQVEQPGALDHYGRRCEAERCSLAVACVLRRQHIKRLNRPRSRKPSLGLLRPRPQQFPSTKWNRPQLFPAGAFFGAQVAANSPASTVFRRFSARDLRRNDRSSAWVNVYAPNRAAGGGKADAAVLVMPHLGK
jgi:hypothetical protein